MGCCATRSEFFALGYLFPGAAARQIPGIKTNPHMPYHVLNYAEHDGDLTFSKNGQEHDLSIGSKCTIIWQSVVDCGTYSTYFSFVVNMKKTL
jgi:hypothetical protein